MLPGPMKVLDTSVISEIKAFSQTELLRRLFPSMKVKERGAMSSPFREDRNPSYSCFIGHGGVWKGKDFATGEVYDNINLYRKLHPELGFPEAIDDLSRIILGHTAFRGMDRGEYYHRTLVPCHKTIHKPQADRESILRVLSVSPILSGSTPAFLKDYWRSRCISDDNIASTCVHAVFETEKLKGHILADGVSGLPVLDEYGEPVKDDGIRDAVGFYNDIGGVVFRVPETAVHKGFKGGTSSFVSTLLPDGSRPSNAVFFKGEGTGLVERIEYNPRTFSVEVNGSQFFWPVAPEVYPFAVPFLQEWKGSVLDERDVKGICAVLTGLNSPHCGRAVVVEGVFDALSYMELRGARNGYTPGCDLIVLNSINNVRWAVPNLCMEREVIMIYDNDIRTGAGRKSFENLRNQVKEYSGKCRVVPPAFKSGEGYLAGCKDLNEALVNMVQARKKKEEIKPKNINNYGNQQQKKAEPARRGAGGNHPNGIR